MEVEYIDRINYRKQHHSYELDEILDYATSLNNYNSKELYVKTNFYRQFLKDNPNASKKEKDNEKIKSFSAIIFAGTFSGTCKAVEIKQMSGLIVIDFDHLENLNKVRQQLENDIFTYLLFVSPSNDGLKLIIKHNLSDAAKWKYLFEELQDYYFGITGINIDKSGKDINRVCYVPYIDKLYRKNDSWVWTYKGKFERKECGENHNSIVEYQQPEITDELYKECFYVSVFLAENQINIAEEYHDWISYGYMLCVFGEAGRNIYHNISSVSAKYDRGICDKQYDYMLTTFDEERTNINHYLTNAKKAMANYMIFKRFGFLYLQ